jgi:hypothetical protein
LAKPPSSWAVALVCGGIDLLAALHLVWCAAREDIVAPVAIIPTDTGAAGIASNALALFKDKAVCLFPYADKAGRQAGDMWGRQLLQAGIEPETYDFGGLATTEGFPVITLRDFAHIDPDQWEEHRDTIEAAFNFGPSPLAPPEETPQYDRQTQIHSLWTPVRRKRAGGQQLRQSGFPRTTWRRGRQLNWANREEIKAE